jgi:hypothetical protein
MLYLLYVVYMTVEACVKLLLYMFKPFAFMFLIINHNNMNMKCISCCLYFGIQIDMIVNFSSNGPSKGVGHIIDWYQS